MATPTTRSISRSPSHPRTEDHDPGTHGLARRMGIAGMLAGVLSAMALYPRPAFLLVPALSFPLALAWSGWRCSRLSGLQTGSHLVVAVVVALISMFFGVFVALGMIGLVGEGDLLSLLLIGGSAGAVGALIFSVPWKVPLVIENWRDALLRPSIAGAIAGALGVALGSPFVDASDDPKWVAVLILMPLWQGAVGWALGNAAEISKASSHGSSRTHSE